jgi:hypothetical protein
MRRSGREPPGRRPAAVDRGQARHRHLPRTPIGLRAPAGRCLVVPTRGRASSAVRFRSAARAGRHAAHRTRPPRPRSVDLSRQASRNHQRTPGSEPCDRWFDSALQCRLRTESGPSGVQISNRVRTPSSRAIHDRGDRAHFALGRAERPSCAITCAVSGISSRPAPPAGEDADRRRSDCIDCRHRDSITGLAAPRADWAASRSPRGRGCLSELSCHADPIATSSSAPIPSRPYGHPRGAAGDGDALGTVADGERVGDVIGLGVDPRDRAITAVSYPY